MLNFGLKLAKIITYIFSVWFHGFPLMLFVDFWLKIPVLDCELLKVGIGTLFSFKWMSPPFKEALYVFLWVVRFFDYNNFLCPSAHGNIPPPKKKMEQQIQTSTDLPSVLMVLGLFLHGKIQSASSAIITLYSFPSPISQTLKQCLLGSHQRIWPLS